jgi:hypothetical protein
LGAQQSALLLKSRIPGFERGITIAIAALKGNILEVDRDPSPGKRRRDSGFQKKG